MSSSELLTQTEVAELLNVNRHMLSKAAPYLPDFPVLEQVGGRRRRYRRAEILAWSQDRDVKALVSAGGSQARAGEVDAAAAAFNQLATRFIKGDFAPPELQQQYQLKKIIARQCRRVPRRVVRYVPDWAQDQRSGYEHPESITITRHK